MDARVLMGHSSITVTFDIYGHVFADVRADRQPSWHAATASSGMVVPWVTRM